MLLVHQSATTKGPSMGDNLCKERNSLGYYCQRTEHTDHDHVAHVTFEWSTAP